MVTEAEAKVGQDVEAICGKCGDVWHIVVAKVGEKIAKVQCKECDAYHKYRPPQHVKDALKKSRASSSKSSTTTTKTKTKKSTTSRSRRRVDVPEPTIDADLSRPVRDYSPRAAYEPADRIAHKKFGEGIVEEAVPGKITVFFTELTERKMLAQARGETAELPERPEAP